MPQHGKFFVACLPGQSRRRRLIGGKTRDLPIEQPTQYHLVINLKAAKALGLTIPESILLLPDE
jgi:putative ABC transport system substrate-binding protein